MKLALFDIENWREIGATLSRNKTRTFLTAFGIFWGTAMLAMLLGGAKGMENMLRRNFEGFATNTAILFPGRTTMSYKGFNKGTSWNLTFTDLQNIREGIPEITALTGINNIAATVGKGTLSTTTTAQGVESDYSKIFEPKILEGRFINESDDILDRKVCVIGKNVAGDLFPGTSPIGEYIDVNGVYFKIVGVAYQTSEVNIGAQLDDAVVIPMNTFKRAFSQGDNLGGMMFTVQDGTTPTDVRNRLQRILSNNHPIHPEDKNAMFFMDVSEQFKMVDNLFLGISLLAFFVGAGTLIAGIIGVGNIMWVIVKERTQEIGIRRAIGAKPLDIIIQILSEGIALTVIAGIAGISFATFALKVAETLTADPVKGTVEFMLSFRQAMEIVITFIILGVIAGLIPAIKAMKIKPIEAMNSK